MGDKGCVEGICKKGACRIPDYPTIRGRIGRWTHVWPEARELPELEDDDPQFGALVDDIRASGIQSPLEIDKHNRIVDGRHRWRAAKKLAIKDVPVIVHEDSEVIAIILRALLLRRHYSKGALAYTAFPLIQAAYEDARANPSKRVVHSVHNPFTIEVQAERLGISRRLYHQAQEVHEIFSKDQEYKDLVLPEIISGEAGLGAVIAGWAGRNATKGRPKPKEDYLKLCTRTWTDLKVRHAYPSQTKRASGSSVTTTAKSSTASNRWRKNEPGQLPRIKRFVWAAFGHGRKPGLHSASILGGGH